MPLVMCQSAAHYAGCGSLHTRPGRVCDVEGAPPPRLSFLFCIPAERRLFTRERSDGLYTTFTSLAGKMVDEMVIDAIVA